MPSMKKTLPLERTSMFMRTKMRTTSLLAFALLASCGGDGDGGAPDPAELVASSADRMGEVNSFAFLLEHENGSTMIVGGLAMERAEGEIANGERLRADVMGRTGPLAVNLQLIIVPEGAWMTNPLTGAWTPQVLSISEFFDPATGVTAVIRGIGMPSLTGTEVVGGVETHIVDGSLDSGALALLIPGVPAGRPLTVRTWIGSADPVVHRIEIRGTLADGDNPTVVRRLTLSQFGATFEITAPL
jgi:hypothetical protein